MSERAYPPFIKDLMADTHIEVSIERERRRSLSLYHIFGNGFVVSMIAMVRVL